MLLSKQRHLNVYAIVDYINGWQKSKDKLPSWHSNEKVVFPSKLNMEQCSSETTALYKSLLTNGKKMIDITGGMGVDTYYFSNRFEKCIYIEQNESLFEIAKHNFEIFGKKNIECYSGNGINFLQNTNSQDFDLIYIDPARRDGAGKKVFILTDCEPDVVHFQDLLLSKSKNILIKTSPLLDIDKTISELKYIKEVHVVAVENECKELLFLLEKGFDGVPSIVAVNYSKNEWKKFTYRKFEEEKTEIEYSNPLKYLYEPNTAILKSGAFKSVSKHFNVYKLSSNSHLYTSDTENNNFQGRIFKILAWGSEKEMKSGLIGLKCNVISRNHPLTPEEIKKKYKLKDGGNTFLIASLTNDRQYILLVCERLA